VSEGTSAEPDSTAVRTALWRALHTEVDARPHLITDTVGLRLASPSSAWRNRGDMNPVATQAFRTSIVTRARYLDDLVTERAASGVRQYVILGAGLDSFAQRHADVDVVVFEIDQPGTQEWKRRRLAEEGLDVPGRPRFVPVDFESGESWWDGLLANGFDPSLPAVVASAGVSMYLSRAANAATLERLAALAPGSTLAMTFMLPVALLDDVEGPLLTDVAARAAESGTPFVSLYSPAEIVEACLRAGFASAGVVGPDELARRYFVGRTDGLRPPVAEQLVLAQT
jgi:methyltransferase (TIGR00027 family)